MIGAIVILTVSLIYTLLLIRLTIVWNRMEPTDGEMVPVSVVVVYRNEEENLPELLRSLSSQDVASGQVEFIFIDDDSTDKSTTLVEAFCQETSIPARNVSLKAHKRTGKKSGVELAVSMASFDHILLTDADCAVPENWIQTMSKNGDLHFLSGPVCYKSRLGLIPKMIQLDLMSLSVLGGCTIELNRPSLANGANMRFSKKAFNEVGGYTDNKNIPSGDDVFLLMSLASESTAKIGFIKMRSSIVETEMAKSAREFLNQRIRWAGKTRYTAQSANQLIPMALVLSYLAFFMIPVAGLWMANAHVWCVLLSALLIKIVGDYVFFAAVLRFYGKTKLLSIVWLTSVVHPIYVVIIAVLSLFLPYEWKSRKVSHG